jgi:hypothetical protein
MTNRQHSTLHCLTHDRCETLLVTGAWVTSTCERMRLPSAQGLQRMSARSDLLPAQPLPQVTQPWLDRNSRCGQDSCANTAESQGRCNLASSRGTQANQMARPHTHCNSPISTSRSASWAAWCRRRAINASRLVCCASSDSWSAVRTAFVTACPRTATPPHTP